LGSVRCHPGSAGAPLLVDPLPKPRNAPGARYNTSISMGFHEGSANQISGIIRSLREEFPPGSYNVVSKNCNHFANALCLEITGQPVPSWVNRAATLGSMFAGTKAVTHQNNSGDSAAPATKDEDKNVIPNNGDRRYSSKKELTEKQRKLLEKIKSSSASKNKEKK